MRGRLIFGMLLALVLTGLLLVSVRQMDIRNEALENYRNQYEHLQQREDELAALEAELAALRAPEEIRAELVAEREAKLQALEAEKEALLKQTEEILKAIDTIRQADQEEDSDQSYFLEVYDALTEGYNKVKEYIAGN